MILDPCLTFKEHVSYIRSKVVPRLKMLDRLRHILNKHTKITLYKTLIAPLFDYGDVIYEGISQVDSASLQKLQNSGLRRVLNCDIRTHIDEMHRTLNIDELSVRRKKHVNCQVFKCINQLTPRNVSDMINVRNTSLSMVTRSVTQGDLTIPRTNLDLCRRNFKFKGPLQWQKLPLHVRNSPSLPSFKRNQNQLPSLYFW